MRAKLEKDIKALRSQAEAEREAYEEKARAHQAPAFGIIKSVLGFTRFHLRGLEKVKNE